MSEFTAVIPPNLVGAAWWGSGADGNVIVSNNTTLTRDMYYNNLTVLAGVNLKTAGYRVFVAGTLMLAGKISNSGSDAVGAAGGAGAPSGTVGGGTNGANGGTGNGAASAAKTNSATPGQGGTGGSSGANTGGPGGTVTPLAAGQSTPQDFLGAFYGLSMGASLLTIEGGTGGGAGAGDGTHSGGGGGGGGGVLVVNARQIVMLTSGLFDVTGGEGAAGTGGNAGGGGGGGVGVLIINTQVGGLLQLTSGLIPPPGMLISGAFPSFGAGNLELAGGAGGAASGTGNPGAAGTGPPFHLGQLLFFYNTMPL